MSYETLEAGLQGQIELAVPNIKCSLNDYTRTQQGSQKVAVLKFGSFEQSRQATGGWHLINWLVDIEVLCRFTNVADTRNLLRDTRNAIINRVNQYPKLGATTGAFDALIVRGQRLPNIVELGSFAYLGEVLTCQIQEELDVDYQE